MRIAINCRSILTRKPTGIGRYTFELIQYLKRIDQTNQYSLYARLRFIDFKRRFPRIGNKNFSPKLDHFNAGPQKILGKIDVYHAPSPELLSVQNCKVVVTVHDLIYRAFPQGHTPETIAMTDRQFKDIVARADKIICTSEHTQKDLHHFFSLPPERSCVVYQGVDQDVFYRIEQKELLAAEHFFKKNGIVLPYLLFVGTIEPRKNLVHLLKAFALLLEQKKFSGQLVVVGMKGWMTEGLKQMIEDLKLGSKVVFMGFVSDDELRVLYNKAEVFVFPSFYEGFGFPIVEAMSCGAPVVTSKTSSCAEVAGDAALTVDPHSPEGIARAVGRILQDGLVRNALIEKGLKRSQEFSFLETAKKTLKVYQEVCGM